MTIKECYDVPSLMKLSRMAVASSFSAIFDEYLMKVDGRRGREMLR
jgi:hypothetical protein